MSEVISSKYTKPFSKGQITLPKDFRETLGITTNSWLELSLLEDGITVKPVKDNVDQRSIKPSVDLKTYKKILPEIDSSWFDEKENQKIRSQVEKRLGKYAKDTD